MIEQGYHYNFPMSRYLADPCPEPSLSTGTVTHLIERSAAHAKLHHPRFGNVREDAGRAADMGSAVHTLALGGERVVFLPYDNFRTKEAQQRRDEIKALGQIPLLQHEQESAGCAAQAARDALAKFGAGVSEVTLAWKLDDVWCRGRADWLTEDGKYDIDVKTVQSADPIAFQRQVVSNGYDVQMALRWLGHQAIGDRTRDMLWLLQEVEAPYATKIVGVSPNLIDLGVRKVRRAAKIWAECLKTGVFPGFDDSIVWMEPPTYAMWDAESRGL